MMTPAQRMARRALAAEACITRFADRPYEPGKRDCTLMARHCLHKLGLKVPFAKGIRYESELGGVRALKKAGFSNLVDAVDSLGLPRIGPASALPADLVALPTDHTLGSLAVCIGPASWLAYAEDFEGATRIENVSQFLEDAKGPVAWRTLPTLEVLHG